MIVSNKIKRYKVINFIFSNIRINLIIILYILMYEYMLVMYNKLVTYPPI